MPQLNPNPITPELFLFVYCFAAVQEVAGFIPVLPEALLHEAQTRATNFAIQYGGLVIGIAGESGILDLDPRAPLKLVQYGWNELQNASSMEEATTKGLIALGALSLTTASSSEAATSAAWAAFVAVFMLRIAGYQVIIPGYLWKDYIIIYVLKKGVSLCYQTIRFLANESLIEIERRKLNLPRKRPKLKLKQKIKNKIARLNPFQRNKRKPNDLIMSVLRVKKREFKIRSYKFSLYVPYNKKIVVKTQTTPMVKPILIY